MDKPNHMKLRTTIMVASMIALPMAAVLGLKWPHFEAAEQATAQTHDHDHRHGHPHPTEQGGTATAAASSAPAPTWSPGNTTAADPSANANPDSVVQAGGPNAVYNANHQVVPVSNNDIRAVGGSTPESNTGRFILGVGGSNASAGHTPPVDESAQIRPLPVPTETVAATDPFSQIQQRLRALGALHYSLETWGSQGEGYRFQCRMAAGHSPNYSRHFEATDVDPLRVMQTVLVEIESWKSGRLP